MKKEYISAINIFINLIYVDPWVWVYEFEQIEKPKGWPL